MVLAKARWAAAVRHRISPIRRRFDGDSSTLKPGDDENDRAAHFSAVVIGLRATNQRELKFLSDGGASTKRRLRRVPELEEGIDRGVLLFLLARRAMISHINSGGDRKPPSRVGSRALLRWPVCMQVVMRRAGRELVDVRHQSARWGFNVWRRDEISNFSVKLVTIDNSRRDFEMSKSPSASSVRGIIAMSLYVASGGALRP